ncbi:hypothetical protein D3C81_247880 [compost metagenome]
MTFSPFSGSIFSVPFATISTGQLPVSVACPWADSVPCGDFTSKLSSWICWSLVLACSSRLVINTSVSPVSRSCSPLISLTVISSGRRMSGRSGNSGLANSSFSVSPSGFSSGCGAGLAASSTFSPTFFATSTTGCTASGNGFCGVFGRAISSELILVGNRVSARSCHCAPVRNSPSEIAVSSTLTLTLFSASMRKVIGYGVLRFVVGSPVSSTGADGVISLVFTTTSTSCAVRALTHSELRLKHDKSSERWNCPAFTVTPGIWYFTPFSVKSRQPPLTPAISSPGTQRAAPLITVCRPLVVPSK